MSPLGLLFGMFVGFSLGLTGGGGAIFAVPLLVYGMAVDPREAVGVSLVTVGATAVVGLVQRARAQLVEFPTGLLFAAAGMLTAPLGAWLAGCCPKGRADALRRADGRNRRTDARPGSNKTARSSMRSGRRPYGWSEPAGPDLPPRLRRETATHISMCLSAGGDWSGNRPAHGTVRRRRRIFDCSRARHVQRTGD